MSGLFAIRSGSLAAATVAILLAVPGTQAQMPCGYEVTAIIQGPWCGEIYGYPPTRGRAVTEDGAVVGYYTSCDIGPSEAFYWSESSGFVTLDRPAGYTSAGAWDIDTASGWIVGAMTPQGTNRSTATLWMDGQAIDLGTLPGGNFSQARATAGCRIVGKWGNNVTGDPGLAAFLWQEGVMIDLSADLGTPSSRAYDISDSTGRVVGWMGTATSLDARAFIWDAGRVTELPPIAGGFTSEGRAISADGSTVVGVGRLMDRRSGDLLIHPFVWTGGEMSDIGTLPGFAWGAASDVNDDKVVIGTATQAGGSGETGFVWHDAVMAELNDLLPLAAGVHIDWALSINQLGQISCRATDDHGDVVAVLVTPRESPLGDLDNDCHVGIIDLLTLLASWGPCDECDADIDSDGEVGVMDLLILLTNWG